MYAHNTAEQILEGKQFHRRLRALMLVFEALMLLIIKNFYIDLKNDDAFSELAEKLQLFNLKYPTQSFDKNGYDDLLKSVSKDSIPLFEKSR